MLAKMDTVVYQGGKIYANCGDGPRSLRGCFLGPPGVQILILLNKSGLLD